MHVHALGMSMCMLMQHAVARRVKEMLPAMGWCIWPFTVWVRGSGASPLHFHSLTKSDSRTVAIDPHAVEWQRARRQVPIRVAKAAVVCAFDA